MTTAFAKCLLEVDWANDGTWTDETDRLLSVECRRGRDYASQLVGRASAGTLIAQLRNPDGRFASFNASSPLFGSLVPGRPVRFRPKKYEDEVLADSPVSYWRLGEAAGAATAVDLGSGGIDATYTSHADVILGQTGLVDDADTSVLQDNATGNPRPSATPGDVYEFAGLAPFSLECWFRPLTIDGINNPRLMSKQGGGAIAQGYRLFVTAGASLAFQRLQDNAADSVTSANGSIVVGELYHAVATYDGTTMRLYINGVEVPGAVASSKSIQDHTGSLFLGGFVASASLINLHGYFDEPAVYDSALSAERIAAHYAAATTEWKKYPLWQGFLDSLEPSPGARQQEPQVTLRALGPLARIAARKASTQIYTDIETGTAVGHVLDDADWPAADRVIDDGQVTMTRWKADGDSALFHLRELEDTEFGYIGESRDGKIVFEDVHHLLKDPHTTPQATFSDASGAALSYEEIVQQDPWQEIFNVFRASVTTYEVQSLAVLWTLAEEAEIEPGASVEFWATYPNPDSPTEAHSVDAWTTPVASTDYLANSQSGGGGSDITADVSVAVSKLANEMKITLTNNGSVPAFITLLQARGTAVFKNDPIRRQVEDAGSQSAYGVRTFPLPGDFYPDIETAQSFVEYGLSRFKDPVPVLSLGYQANQSAAHMTQALARDVSERITVKADATNAAGAQLGIDQDFFIEAVTHRYTLSGHWVRYELSDAEMIGGYWVLGISRLGIDTRLVVG